MICVFYAQTVWPSTLPHTNGLACNFYAQTVWPPTKLATQRVGVRIRSDTATPKKSYTATPAPPLHGRRPIHIVAVIVGKDVFQCPVQGGRLTHDSCGNMAGSAAMEGEWGYGYFVMVKGMRADFRF